MPPEASVDAGAEPPLCVDLDGTLIQTDSAWELALALLKHHPLLCLLIPWWLRRGIAYGKAQIAQRVELAWASLPYTTALLERLREEKARGRRLVLVTGADERVARGVAEHLGLFGEILASDGVTNLVSRAKAGRLVERYGEGGFDYAGNCAKDHAVWEHCRHALLVNCSPGVVRRRRASGEIESEFAPGRAGLGLWLKSLRLHQWAKSLLIFVPLLTSHQIHNPARLLQTLLAFVSFGLAASCIYTFNDLLDLEADRLHPTKRRRPLASGAIPIPAAIAVAAGCLLVSVLLASRLPAAFLWCFAAYYVLTTAYSLALKRMVMLDVLTLASLYGMRVVAGATAIAVPLSYWLLVFCIFVFLSLAFIKRYTELKGSTAARLAGRGYAVADIEMVMHMGVASGYVAGLVLALYVASPAVDLLYQRPAVLWPMCLAYLYWIGRAWLLAHRGEMKDDPVVFALRDRTSYVIGALLILIGLAAHPL